MQSALFEFSQGNITCLQERIPKILAGLDQTGDGHPETLLAQEYDANTIFGRRIWKGDLSGTSLHWSDPGMPLPRQFQVTGSAFADVTGDGSLETVVLRQNILFIFSGQKALYQSSVPVGGSLSTLVFDKNTSSQNQMTDSVVFEAAPVIADLNQDKAQEICVPSFQTDLFGSITGQGGAKQSQLVVLSYDQGRFEQGTLGGFLDGSVQGLAITPERAYVVTSQKGGIFESGGVSSVLSFALE